MSPKPTAAVSSSSDNEIDVKADVGLNGCGGVVNFFLVVVYYNCLPSSSGSLAREQGGEVGEGASPRSVSALGDNTIDSATKGSSTGTGVVAE